MTKSQVEGNPIRRIRLPALFLVFLSLLPPLRLLATDPLATETNRIAALHCLLRKIPVVVALQTHEQPKVWVGEYAPARKILERMRSTLSPDGYREFEEWYESHFFYDRYEFLVDNLASKATKIIPPARYNRNGERPFDGYRAARAKIASVATTDLALEDLLVAHTALLSKASTRESAWSIFWQDWRFPRNSEDTKNHKLGVIRNEERGYADPKQTWTAYSRSIERITAPGKEGEHPARLMRSPETYQMLSKINPFIGFDAQTGQVDYVNPIRWRSYKHRLSPKMISKLKSWEATLDHNQALPNVPPELFQEVLTDLMKGVLGRLRKDLRRAKTEANVIQAAAKFYYDFLSVHPFYNGNGRMGRLITERILREYGIAPPIWTHFGHDIALQFNDFVDLFAESIALSGKFHRDLETLSTAGIDYWMVPTAYFTPDAPRRMNFPLEAIIPEEFLTWVSLVQRNTQIHGLSDLFQDYMNWRSEFNYYNGDGERRIGIAFATPLFIVVFFG